MTASAPPSADTWVYDHAASVFFHPVSNTYAVPDPVSGQWSYIPASDFLGAESSARARSQGANESSLAQSGSTGAAGDAVEGEKEEREEGEIEDDVGWGGLMEPEQLQAVLKTRNPIHTVPGSTTLSTRPQSNALEKHPAYTAAYDDPKLYAYPSQTQLEPADPPTATPTHILRLVVQESKVLTPGQVVIIDARQGGIQLGRDRCERGAQARMRLREMEVSKTHAVVYHGQKGDTDLRELDQQGDSAWWIVDLGTCVFLVDLGLALVLQRRIEANEQRRLYTRHVPAPPIELAVAVRPKKEQERSYKTIRTETLFSAISSLSPIPDYRRQHYTHSAYTSFVAVQFVSIERYQRDPSR